MRLFDTAAIPEETHGLLQQIEESLETIQERTAAIKAENKRLELQNQELKATEKVVTILQTENERLKDQDIELKATEKIISLLQAENERLVTENQDVVHLEHFLQYLQSENSRLRGEIDRVGDGIHVSAQVAFSKVVTELSKAVTESTQTSEPLELSLRQFMAKLGNEVMKASAAFELIQMRLLQAKGAPSLDFETFVQRLLSGGEYTSALEETAPKETENLT